MVIRDQDIRIEGHVFKDDEIDNFFDKFYHKLQKKLAEVRGYDTKSASELSQASSILRRPDAR